MGLLRFLLALAVVVFHSGNLWGMRLMGGREAVEAFFVISGFYMALILNEKYASGIQGTYLFLSNRFLKIFPLYWAVWLLTLVFCLLAWHFFQQPTQLSTFINYGKQLSIRSWLTLVFANVFIFGQDIFFFLKLGPHGDFIFSDQLWKNSPHVFNFLLVPQAWSVECELFFYLMAPYFVRRLSVALLVVFSSFILRILFFYKGYHADPWTYRFFFFELQFFFSGVVVYYLYKYLKRKAFLDKQLFGKVLMVLLLAFTVTYAWHPSSLYFLPDHFLVFHGAFFVFEFKFWIYILLLCISIPFLFSITKKSVADRQIGELSYPIYISHMFVIYITEVWGFISNPSLRVVFICLCTICFSIILNRYILNPIEKYRQKRVQMKMPKIKTSRLQVLNA